MKKNLSKILLIIAAVFFIFGIIFCAQGFDKKNSYYYSESYYSANQNAYVGGDAYNYIINGTYFAGFCALGGSMFVCGTVCGIGAALIEKKDRGQDNSINTHNDLPDL